MPHYSQTPINHTHTYTLHIQLQICIQQYSAYIVLTHPPHKFYLHAISLHTCKSHHYTHPTTCIYTCTQPIVHTLPNTKPCTLTYTILYKCSPQETSLYTHTYTHSADMHTYTIHTQPTSDTCLHVLTHIFSPYTHACHAPRYTHVHKFINTYT